MTAGSQGAKVDGACPAGSSATVKAPRTGAVASGVPQLMTHAVDVLWAIGEQFIQRRSHGGIVDDEQHRLPARGCLGHRTEQSAGKTLQAQADDRGRLPVAPGDGEVARRRVLHRVREQQRRDLARGGQCIEHLLANLAGALVGGEHRAQRLRWKRAVLQRLGDAGQHQPHCRAGAAALVGGQHRRAGHHERRCRVRLVAAADRAQLRQRGHSRGQDTRGVQIEAKTGHVTRDRLKISEQLLPPNPKLLLMAWRSFAGPGLVTRSSASAGSWVCAVGRGRQRLPLQGLCGRRWLRRYLPRPACGP